MITADILEKNLKNNKIDNAYIFCGLDEELIKDSINNVIKPFTSSDSLDLNYIKIDAVKADMDIIRNACETMPFFSDKKIVLISRANFLKEKCDSSGKELYEEMKEYIKDIPDFTILLLYYVFDDKRDNPKKNKKVMALDNDATIVYVEKLKRDGFIKKVSDIFKRQNANINNVSIRYFCDKVPTNFEIINSEIEKLICYTNGREITRKDIDLLLPRKSEDDIFDLVDLISQRKIEKAMDILDEILFKEDKHILIVVSIENQFKTLYNVKGYLNQGKGLEDIIRILHRPKFVVEKLIALSKKFTRKQLVGLLDVCLETEKSLKSTTTDKKTSLELLLIKTLMVKKN